MTEIRGTAGKLISVTDQENTTRLINNPLIFENSTKGNCLWYMSASNKPTSQQHVRLRIPQQKSQSLGREEYLDGPGK